MKKSLKFQQLHNLTPFLLSINIINIYFTELHIELLILPSRESGQSAIVILEVAGHHSKMVNLVKYLSHRQNK